MINPLVEVNSMSCSFKTPKVSDVLEIAKIQPKYEQNRMHYWLLQLMGDAEAVAKMTMQERFAWLLLHMKQTRVETRVNIDDYLADDLNNFSRERVDAGLGLTVRHIYGIEAEALERGAQNVNDWIMGEIAITIANDKFPALDLYTGDVDLVQRSIHNRVNKLIALDIDEYNDLVENYFSTKDLLINLVNPCVAVGGGYILDVMEEKGKKSAPTRFCVPNCIKGHAAELL